MVTGSNPVEGTMNYFNKIYPLMWFFLIVLIMYLSFQDRTVESIDGSKHVRSAFETAPYLSIFIIILLLLLTGIAVLRAIESRNQWRKIAKEDNVREKISNIENKKID